MGEQQYTRTRDQVYFSFLITLFLALVFFLNHVELQIAPVGYNDYPIILIFLLTSLVVLAYTIMQMIGFEFFDHNQRLPLWFRKFTNWIHRLFNRPDSDRITDPGLITERPILVWNESSWRPNSPPRPKSVRSNRIRPLSTNDSTTEKPSVPQNDLSHLEEDNLTDDQIRWILSF